MISILGKVAVYNILLLIQFLMLLFMASVFWRDMPTNRLLAPRIKHGKVEANVSQNWQR
jgi:hypothetical protein